MRTPTGAQIVEVFTDGACRGNPGPGGWGAILRYRGVEKELSGAEPMTTNNRMEMTAAIKALEALKRPSIIYLSTDSLYLKDGITHWIHAWKRNGWKTSDKKPVKNVDLWLRLEAALERHQVSFEWVRGHAGHPENERADALARHAIKEMLAMRTSPKAALPDSPHPARPSASPTSPGGRGRTLTRRLRTMKERKTLS